VPAGKETAMLRKQRFQLTTAAAVVLIGLLASEGSADDRRHHKRPDVDIEKLKGEVWRSPDEWLLRVRYEVEIEDWRRGDAFELVAYVTEDGYRLANPAGQPVEFVIPLDRPSEVDDDELEFESSFTVRLPERSFRDPDRLRLHGMVVFAGDSLPLEKEDTSIKYDRPKVKVRRQVVTTGVSVSHHRVVSHRVGVGVRVGVHKTKHVTVAPRRVRVHSRHVAVRKLPRGGRTVVRVRR
jgi:hypothetical protein